MPQVFKIGSYWVYFWSNENKPLEPVHVHIAKGKPKPNGTKVWITQTGKCIIENNNSHISEKTLRDIVRVIEARSEYVISKWEEFFGETRFFC